MTAVQMEDSHSSRRIKIYLDDINRREPISRRTIHLLPPQFEVKIGRGSQAELSLHPHERNAWFTSRVMSREHATLRADPETKLIMLQDTGSMHGTYLNGKRLGPDESVAVLATDRVQFGAEIVRGDQAYKPLELDICADWNDNPTPRRPWLDSYPGISQTSKNSFSVDYSDEDDDDEGVEVVYESIQNRDITLQRTNSKFSVPDSDESDRSDMEDDNESAPSSPAEEDVQKTTSATIIVNVPSTAEDCIITSTSVRPGSSAQNALDLEDDVEQAHEIVTDMPDLEDIEPVDEFSDDQSVSSGEEDYELEPFCCEPEHEEDEMDDENEVEEQGFDDQRNESVGQTATQTSAEAHHRSPSPSDCALPRPSWYLHNTASSNLPAIQNLVDQVAPQPTLFGEPFSAGLSSNYLPCTPYHSIEPYPHMLPSFEQPYHVQSPNQFYSLAPTTSSYHQFAVSDKFPTAPDSLNPERTTCGIKPMDKSSKVSINNIIEETQSEFIDTNSRSKKRKADDISTHVNADQTIKPTTSTVENSLATKVNLETGVNTATGVKDKLEASEETQTVVEAVGDKVVAPKKSVTFSTTAIMIDSDATRPFKKVKREHKHQGGTLLKYAAATLAGATLGAIGTVFGLAALPADYFV